MGMENPFDIAGEPDLTDSVITCVGCSCACVCHVHIRVFKNAGRRRIYLLYTSFKCQLTVQINKI